MSSSQKCPNCKTQMKSQEVGPKSFWVCSNCGGRLIDIELVKENLSPLYFRRIRSRIDEDRFTKGKKKCSSCTKPLDVLPVKNGPQSVRMDYCGKCTSLFFDVDELEKLPQLTYPKYDLSLPPDIKRDVSHSAKPIRATNFKISLDDFGLGWSKKKFYKLTWKILPGLLGLPVETEDNLSRKPILNYILILVTTITSLIGFYWIPDLFETLGLQGENGFRYGGINFLTYWFVHANWYHLLSNMYFLWIFGDNVEDDLGRGPYTIMLLTGTILGGLAQYLFTPTGEFILGGASGGISAIILYYVLRFPRAKLAQMFVFVWIRIPAYIYAIFWIGLQWLTLQSQLLGETRVSALAHTGGAIAGFLAWFIWRFQPEEDNIPIKDQ